MHRFTTDKLNQCTRQKSICFCFGYFVYRKQRKLCVLCLRGAQCLFSIFNLMIFFLLFCHCVVCVCVRILTKWILLILTFGTVLTQNHTNENVIVNYKFVVFFLQCWLLGVCVDLVLCEKNNIFFGRKVQWSCIF